MPETAPTPADVLAVVTQYGDGREATARAELQEELDAAVETIDHMTEMLTELQDAFDAYRASHPDTPPPPPAKPAPIDGVIWWTHQCASVAEIAGLTTRLAGHKRNVPNLGGVSIRMQWDAVDTDEKVIAALEAIKALGDSIGVPMAFRLMAGRHTPAAVLAKCVTYADPGAGTVPRPWDNPGFEDAYRHTYSLIAGWMTDNLPDGPRLLHYTWYGRDWAEINAGREVRAVAGYSAENAAAGHARLMSIAHEIQQDYPTVAVEFPGSGYGDVFDITTQLAQHAADLWGVGTDSFYMQANGWSSKPQRWGQPDETREKRLDAALEAVGSFGLQAIQPWGQGSKYPAYTATDWQRALTEAEGARYLEIYDPSFDAVAGKELTAF